MSKANLEKRGFVRFSAVDINMRACVSLNHALTNASASLLSAFDAFGDAVADFLIDVTPVFEGPLQHGFGHAVFQMPHHIGHQPVALRIVHDLAHQGAGLAEIIVVLALGIGGTDELAAGTPDGHLGIPLRIGFVAAL